ncbi:hypothetical protein LJC24_00470 [Desulfococcaceae bacterium OttesenSCG-928-F15]|nr:hypothetical protein [Desulfococcaceae bacterium OttesenSCG-928-F15]
MLFDTLKELLEARFAVKKPGDSVVFIYDDELAELADLTMMGPEGEPVFNPALVVQKANELGYWCEADWDEKGGGFVFALLTRR